MRRVPGREQPEDLYAPLGHAAQPVTRAARSDVDPQPAGRRPDRGHELFPGEPVTGEHRDDLDAPKRCSATWSSLHTTTGPQSVRRRVARWEDTVTSTGTSTGPAGAS